MKPTTFLQFAGFTLLCAAPLSAVPTDANEVNPVEVGSTAPNVTLTKADGAQVELHELVSENPAVIVFYRGGWCPYCNHRILPVPAVFLIGRDAKIHFRYYNPDYKERLSGEALLKAARENKPD